MTFTSFLSKLDELKAKELPLVCRIEINFFQMFMGWGNTLTFCAPLIATLCLSMTDNGKYMWI